MSSFSSRHSIWQPWLSTVMRWGLALVFVSAGWPKLIHTEDTVRSVRAFRLLPEVAVRPFAYALPLLELILAVLLLVGLFTRLSALITAALMVMFLFGITAAWARGLEINCGCFGGSTGAPADPVAGYIRDILRDIGFLAMAGYLVRWPFSRLALDHRLGLTSPRSADAAEPLTTGALR